MRENFKCADCETVPGKRTIGGWGGYPLDVIGPCRTCKGTGTVTVDSDAISEAIKGRKGLRTSKPTADVFGAVYVWRMARFHGGADTTMPITCYFSIGVGGIIPQYVRPMLDTLDRLADIEARKYFGTDLGAAKAWSGLI